MIKRKSLFASIILAMISYQSIKAQNTSIESAGDVGIIIVPIAVLSATLIKGDKKGAWQFTKGFLFNQAVTLGLKSIINKPRPDLSNNNAFPSGHTSTTFQGASFIHRRYGFKYSISAYAVAGFTAFSRINAKKHDGWDVLAGAIIGIGSSWIFTTPYQQEHYELSFKSSHGEHLVGLRYKF